MPVRAVYPDLADRTVFVTGGGGGIGAAIVRSFAAQGARVGFVDIAEEAGRTLAAEIGEETGRAPLFIACDIRDVEALQAAVAATADAFGDVGVLVNNAANDDRHAVETVTPAYWDERMAINQRPMFFTAQAVLPMMKRLGGGSIVNFGSISWKLGNGGMPAYTTAKAAVHGLTRGLARDFGGFGIRVNTVLPGWIMTERQKRLWLTEEAEREMLAGQCLKIHIAPEQVADLVLFLAADASAACTAQEFTVDAGWS